MTGVGTMGSPWIVSAGGMTLMAAAMLWIPVAPVSFDVAAPGVDFSASSRLGMQLEGAGPVVAVGNVTPASPAAAAGLLPGDVVVALEDQIVTGSTQAAQILNAALPGVVMQVEVVRGGRYLVAALRVPA